MKGKPALLAALLAMAVSSPVSASAQSVKIGVLTDMSSVYADYGGVGSVEAARMAIEDSGAADRVSLVSADHMNKPDIGSALAKEWFSQGVDAIFDVPTSSVALAVNHEAGRSRKLVFFSTTINDQITEGDCNGYGISWVWDTYSVGRTTALMQIRKGMDSWFILTPDGAAGKVLESTARQAVTENGGRVVGALHHPLGVMDWSSYLLQAQASGAKIILFGSGGADLVNGLKQMREFGLTEAGQAAATIYTVITDVHTVGLDTLRGLNMVTAFYWDYDDRTRVFAKRFLERRGKMPTMFQAGVYSAVLQYLKAVAATGGTQAERVRDHLRSTALDDAFLRNGRLLPNGRMIHDMLVGRIKTPEEQRYPWDYYDIREVAPAADAFRKLADSQCPLR